MTGKHRDRMSAGHHALSKPALLASSTGTALACICMMSLVIIRKTVPGLWSLAVIAVAYVLCRIMAAVFAHLVKKVPSGAGMFAFVARAWGPSAGVVVIAPYIILMILLGALEALIVGYLLSMVIAIPPLWLATLFLVLMWLMCRSGLRLGFRIQAVATWLLIVGMMTGSLWLLAQHTNVGSQFLTAPPTCTAFISAVGRAIFLFMGFELVGAHIESTSAEKIAWSLKAAVLLLALVYEVALLGLNTINVEGESGSGIAGLLPQMTLAKAAGGLPAISIIIGLYVLASVTSLNGAFMGLSRLIAILAAQKILPSAFGSIHAPSMVPRNALSLLFLLSLCSVLAIHYFSLYQAVIFSAAVSASALYAVALLIRARSPFYSYGTSDSRWYPWAGSLLAAMFGMVALGVIADAGEERTGLLILLGITYGAGIIAAFRFGTFTKRRSTSAAPVPLKEGTLA